MNNIITEAILYAKAVNENGLNFIEDYQQFINTLDDYASNKGYYCFYDLLITNVNNEGTDEKK